MCWCRPCWLCLWQLAVVAEAVAVVLLLQVLVLTKPITKHISTFCLNTLKVEQLCIQSDSSMSNNGSNDVNTKL